MFVVSVLAGLLPLMAGLIIIVSQREIPVSVIHAAGISPLAEMLYATLLSMPESLVPAGPLREAMATASLRWTLVMGALLLWHWAHLRRHWKKRRSELKAAA